MRLCDCFLCAFILCVSLKESGAVSSSGHLLLSSLKEYYLFKPFQSPHHGTKIEADAPFTTLLSKCDGRHLPATSISFTANGTTYNLALELNEDLIPDGFTASYLGGGKNGEDLFEKFSLKDINNCYYHGHVTGIKNSQVVASTCNGLKGTIFLPNDILQFAPVDEQNKMHVLYRPQDLPKHDCGTKHFESFHRTMIASDSQLEHTRWKRATAERKFVELMFVADSNEYKAFGTRTKLHDHIKEIINHIDALYKKLKLRVVLLHVEVWESEDKIPSSANPEKVLADFLEYRKDRIQSSPSNSPWTYTDNAQLLYGGSFDGSTVGMATVSSMCGLRSGGVNEDRMNALQTASTVAHEMGHNFGMSHDTNKCVCDGKKCVMAPTSGATAPDAWSDCSVDFLNKGFQHGTATCLTNVPDSSRLFGGPKCGNGIVETGEKCDCGLPDECESICCNATTCQLLSDAQCDDGACCTADCHFKQSCSMCRASANDCDIAEYCTGHSAHCPGNIHKMDGMNCRTASGICYGGICRTHEMQCQEIWGPDAKNGEEQCYVSVNKKGDSNGNCGREGPSFKKCSPGNVLCGKLLCTGGEAYPLVASDRIFFKNNFKNYVCKTLSSVNDSTDAGDPGVVWDGTKCGEGKMCFDGVCANVSTIFKPCNNDCHGHGICNNFGNCHCDAGWAFPGCSQKGNGGSADSGPICVSHVDTQVVLMLVFFLVILPIVLGIISYVWWRYCGGREKIFAWRQNRAYRKGKHTPAKVEAERKENMGAVKSAQPSGGFKPAPKRTEFSNIENKQPTAPYVSRPPPPSRPSPRIPVRHAPAAPARPPQVPQKPPPPSVAFRRAPENGTTGTQNRAQQNSIQARIAQLQRNNAV